MTSSMDGCERNVLISELSFIIRGREKFMSTTETLFAGRGRGIRVLESKFRLFFRFRIVGGDNAVVDGVRPVSSPSCLKCLIVNTVKHAHSMSSKVFIIFNSSPSGRFSPFAAVVLLVDKFSEAPLNLLRDFLPLLLC